MIKEADEMLLFSTTKLRKALTNSWLPFTGNLPSLVNIHAGTHSDLPNAKPANYRHLGTP